MRFLQDGENFKLIRQFEDDQNNNENIDILLKKLEFSMEPKPFLFEVISFDGTLFTIEPAQSEFKLTKSE